jgi:hypothetical protein
VCEKTWSKEGGGTNNKKKILASLRLADLVRGNLLWANSLRAKVVFL